MDRKENFIRVVMIALLLLWSLFLIYILINGLCIVFYQHLLFDFIDTASIVSLSLFFPFSIASITKYSHSKKQFNKTSYLYLVISLSIIGFNIYHFI